MDTGKNTFVYKDRYQSKFKSQLASITFAMQEIRLAVEEACGEQRWF